MEELRGKPWAWFFATFAYAGEVQKAVVEEDCQFVANFIRQEFDVVFSENLIPKMRKVNAVWSNQTWRLWIKNRLEEKNLFPNGCNSDFPHFATTFHVFFLQLDETEEMLARLRNEPAEEAKTAKSKIFNPDSRKPIPIDRVAMNVAPMPFGLYEEMVK